MPVSFACTRLIATSTDQNLCVGISFHLPSRPGCPNNRYVFHCPSPPIKSHLLCQLTDVGNIALLPLRTRTRGPAYALPPLPASTAAIDVDPDSESYDPLDEVLSLFRANTFFRNFEIKGPADRLLIYGILFVSECLGKVRSTMGSREAEKVNLEPFIIGRARINEDDADEMLRRC